MESYRSKCMSAADAAESIKSGETVFISGGALAPFDVENALPNLIGRRTGIRLMTYLPLAATGLYTVPQDRSTFSMESPFHSGPLRKLDEKDICSFIPLNLRDAARDWLCTAPEIDVMVLTVSPMDRHGYFTLAGQCTMEMDLLPHVKRLIVEVASHAPRVFGDTRIPLSRVWGIVESDRYPCVLPRKAPTKEEELLGEQVAELVEDGATIQLGFGGTIDALARQLQKKQGLGIHTESFSDSAMELMECGAVTNENKSLHPGLTVTSFTMGSERLYDFIDDNLAILHKSLSYTNNLQILAQNRNLISINAALYVDLTGQCASDAAQFHQISGPGGQIDTGVGAQMAGGKSIITVKSARVRKNSSGEPELESNILPCLPLGTPVTYARSNVQYIATEYGVVNLRGQTIRERARLLISIAHPRFRDWLKEEFQRLYKTRL